MTSADGAPLRDVTAVLEHPPGQVQATATTGADGRYAVSGLAPGDYRACFETADAVGGSVATGYRATCFGGRPGDQVGGGTPFSVSDAVGAARVDAVVQPAGEISGRVRDASGDPLGGVQVSIGDEYSAAVITAGDGAFVLRGVDPGSHVVCTDDDVDGTPGATGGTSATGYVRACTTAHVDVATDTVADQVLQAGGAVSGVVTDELGRPMWPEATDHFAFAAFTRSDDHDGETTRIAPVDPDSSFRIDGVAPGSYRVCFGAEASPDTATDPGWAQTCRDDGRFTLVVTAGERQDGVDGVVDHAAGVAGRVVDASGRPVGNASLLVSDSAGHSFLAASASDGSYRVGSLTPGTATVCVQDACGSTAQSVVTIAGQYAREPDVVSP